MLYILKHFFFLPLKAPGQDKHRLHYGGICCYSCRAFFRRAHQNNKTPHFICKKNNSRSSSSAGSSNEGQRSRPAYQYCGVDVTTKRQCQSCRHNRCIDIGKQRLYYFYYLNTIIFQIRLTIFHS